MAKSHSFSIFLLKEGFTVSDSLENEHSMTQIDDATTIPSSASLFIGDNPPRPPWWKAHFGIQQDLHQSLKSALLFVPVKDRHFVLSFGHAYSKLNDNSYEYDFGLCVTLNSIEPQLLNSIDTVEPANGRRRRTQIPNASDISLFGFNKDSAILRNITGRVKGQHKDIFKNPSGAVSLKINSSVPADKIPELLNTLLEIYKDKSYTGKFPGLLNITPVKDPELIALLNDKLLTALKEKSESLHLTIPEIIDYHKVGSIRFKSRKKSTNFTDIYLENYYEYLKQTDRSLEHVNLEDTQKQKIVLLQSDESTEFKSFSLYKCFVFDTCIDGSDDVYNLDEGNWYKVKSSYLEELKNYLDPLCKETNLPNYEHDNEGAYNASVSKQNRDYVCLDRKDISPSKETQIEPCDLFTVDGNEALFIHVKRNTKSASISHLVNQGQNSATVIQSMDESLQKLHDLLKLNNQQQLPSKRSDKFKVCFAIITHKDISKKSEILPLFSRISLMRALKDLNNGIVDAWYEFIPVEKTKESQPPAKQQ